MSKYELKHTAYDGTVTTKTFECDSMSSVLENFELFLKGLGFVFSGTIDVVDETEFNPEKQEHSNHFYDFDRNK